MKAQNLIVILAIVFVALAASGAGVNIFGKMKAREVPE